MTVARRNRNGALTATVILQFAGLPGRLSEVTPGQILAVWIGVALAEFRRELRLSMAKVAQRSGRGGVADVFQIIERAVIERHAPGVGERAELSRFGGGAPPRERAESRPHEEKWREPEPPEDS